MVLLIIIPTKWLFHWGYTHLFILSIPKSSNRVPNGKTSSSGISVAQPALKPGVLPRGIHCKMKIMYAYIDLYTSVNTYIYMYMHINHCNYVMKCNVMYGMGWYSMVLYCICFVLYCIVFVLYCIVLYCVVFVLHCIVLYCMVFVFVFVFVFVLYCIVLYCMYVS